MLVTGQLHALATLPLVQHRNHCIGGWVGSTDSLDFRGEKNLFSLLGLNPQIVQPIA
jgi:hypothetical protein